jgi:uncharacterized protein YndB with AHSA1/START domain
MSPGHDAEFLVHEFEIDAPLEKVWHALTSAELIAQWMLPEGDGDADIELELACSRPPTYVAYHWRGQHEPQTLVTFELRRSEDGSSTRLRLTHQLASTASPGPVALLMAA